MGQLINCPKCGEVFPKERHDLCPLCIKKEQQQLSILKNYLSENPEAELKELVQVTGIAEEVIQTYVRTNRLMSIEESPALQIKCEECGVEIMTGRFCRECREKFSNALNASVSSIKGTKDR
ncbi:MAG: hypothetical protein JKX97_08815 [Candidatus Lindowbacteria bacterium]|nr:hypothetical protein [Candidatus Lindowbacteria bacterium]